MKTERNTFLPAEYRLTPVTGSDWESI